jgi:hypothetical protein
MLHTYGTHRVSAIIILCLIREWYVSEPLYALRVHLSRPPALLHRQHKQILDDYRQLARADILSTLKLFSTLIKGTVWLDSISSGLKLVSLDMPSKGHKTLHIFKYF